MGLPWVTTVIDWDTCKIQYEMLGDSLQRVAATHGVSLEALERVAEEEEWKQLTPSAKGVQEYLANELAGHRAKLSLAAIYRDMNMFPRIVEAESALLDKIVSAIALVDPGDPKAGNALRALGQGLNAIAERKVVGAVDEAQDEGPQDTNWTIEVKEASSALSLVQEAHDLRNANA